MALVQFADNGDVLNLGSIKFAVGAVDLGEDITRINKQQFIVLFVFIKKPQGGWQGHGVKHIRRQGEHAVDQIILDQASANIRFTVARIGCGVGHNQGGTAFFF